MTSQRRTIIWCIDPDQKLSAHLWAKEFADKGGYGYPFPVDAGLILLLQRMRTLAGDELNVSSGWRSPEHNRKVGGASKSMHLFGQAADITIKGLDQRQLAGLALHCGAHGIGLASSYVHVDVRDLDASDPWVGWVYTARGKTPPMDDPTRKSIMDQAAIWAAKVTGQGKS